MSAEVVEKGSVEFRQARQDVWNLIHVERTNQDLDAIYKLYTSSDGTQVSVFSSFMLFEALPRPFSCPHLCFHPFGGRKLEGLIWFCELVFPALCVCVRPDMEGTYPVKCPTDADLQARDAQLAEKGHLDGEIVEITRIPIGDKFEDIEKTEVPA